MYIRGFGLAVALVAAAATGALAQSDEALDYANAKPMPMPMLSSSPTGLIEAIKTSRKSTDLSAASYVPGARGDGLKTPVTLPKQKPVVEPGSIGTQEYGASKHPFTTAIESSPEAWPYRAAGKLFFKIGADTAVCSASLIRRGLVITAAHCVSDYGKDKYFKGFEFVPAYAGGDAPYGVWKADKVFAPKKYLKGTSKCAVRGVVCDTDIAVIVVKPQNKRYPGQSTGWYGYGTGGYSYTNDGLTQITQLGYPVSLNNGQQMMRTDSYGYVDGELVGNTVIGSAQTGGSSGGPWLVNFGVAPQRAGDNPVGTDGERMIVVGATSWGYNDNGRTKQQGASFFKAGVLKEVVDKACNKVPAACAN